MTALTNVRAIPFIHPDDMPDLYALTGVGTCMQPLVSDGACIAFDKRPPVESGDIVGIVFTREAGRRRGLPGLVKRLVAPDVFGQIVVEQVNPRQRMAIPATDVLAIHKMIGIAETRPDGSTFVRLPRREADQ